MSQVHNEALLLLDGHCKYTMASDSGESECEDLTSVRKKQPPQPYLFEPLASCNQLLCDFTDNLTTDSETDTEETIEPVRNGADNFWQIYTLVYIN